MFLEQLTRTLLAEEQGNAAEGTRISGPAGGDATALSQIGVTATAHGHVLLELGFTVDQVVHAYGDLCQAITDLAIEHDEPFSVDQFRTLNRCLDNAIADAVSEFSACRQGTVSREQADTDLAHAFLLAAFVADAKSIAALGAHARGCALAVPEVDASAAIVGNRDHLLAALVNLLQNAFKFTHPHTEVTLHAYVEADRVFIDVKDNCGGLPSGFSEKMFKPFTQAGFDRSGLGLGLAIARRSIEAEGGSLTVRDLPGTGWVFTMILPRHSLYRHADCPCQTG